MNPRSLLRLAVSLGVALASALITTAQSPATGVLVTGRIDLLNIDQPDDPWSSGTMVVAGQVVILPRNLVIQLPANWLSLQQIFEQAPPAALTRGVSGLATLDGPPFEGTFATVHGNRTAFGNVIAGEVFIQKGMELVNGVVTYVDTTGGYLRIDGLVGDDTTGRMIRVNDPESRFTIQQGAGCDGGPNCSPDVRFGVDPDNYTITFMTGYPAGIPSTLPVGQRPGFRAGDDPAAASDASGVGDPFCPSTNRGVQPVPDSTRFAPIRVGDSITAEGNLETVGGVRFLSCHTLTVHEALVTQDTPTQPDYMIFDEVEWDVPAFNNQRVRLLLIGFTTLNDSQLDVFRLHVDRRDNSNHELPLASTVGNPNTINQGIIPGRGGIFKVNYDADFIALIPAGRSPCQNLINAGFGSQCPRGGTREENIAVLSPPTREIIGRTRHGATLLPGVVTRDINGNEATNGQYLTPVGIGYPEFVEIDLGATRTPFSFDGVPWNLDRRLSPVGCAGDCETTPQPLVPFPWSGLDPAALLPSAAKLEPFQVYPFGPADFLAWPPVAPGPFPIQPTPEPPAVGAVAPPEADFSANVSSGVAPLSVAFTDLSSGQVAARLWDFGDGSFSTAAAPLHTYASPGLFRVSLTALGPGGEDTAVRPDLIAVSAPGGPEAPQADFTQDRTAGNTPLTVNFSDLTAGDVTSWLWSFGDGDSSSERDPTHVYTTAGLFTVTLTATGPGGSNVRSRVDLILANQLGGVDIDFSATPRIGSAPLQVRFRTQVLAGQGTGISGTWDFGDGTSAPANGQPILHTYQAPGSYTVTLVGTNGVATDVEQKPGYIQVNAALLGGLR
jgi:PKD repeat protein